MTDKHYPRDHDPCTDLALLLEGKLFLNEGTIKDSIFHWKSCTACQTAHPSALSQLQAIALELESDIRNNCSRLRHRFLSRKHELLSMEPRNTGYSELIVELFNAGDEILFDLGYMNGYGGLSEFTLFPSADEDSEQRSAWRASAQFLRSLEHETQLFVFSAVLACELLRATYRSIKGELSENHIDRLQDPWDKELREKYEADVKRRFIELLSESATDNEVLLNMLETSSAFYQKNYFEENRPDEVEDRISAKSVPGVEWDVESLVQRLREVMKEDMRDLDVGIKTVIDHFSKQYLDGQEEAGRYEPFLRKELGEEVYGQLDFLTRRALQLAEMHYQKNKEPDGYNSCISPFCAAYEMEFYSRIVQPIAAGLLKQGLSDYPLDRTRRSPILMRGQMNDRLSVGDFLHHLMVIPQNQ